MTARARLRENILVTGPKVVTASHAAAATTGATVLERGGNAFDAALAACFMEHIVLPMKCGLAGDLVALFRRDGGPLQSLISIGAGARALANGGIEQTGPRSVGIPGAPHGYSILNGFGRLSLEDLVAPAVRASRQGVPWTRVAQSYVIEGASLLARFSPKNPYAPGGRIPEIGEIRRLPGLGDLLKTFARERERLFEGELGARVTDFLSAGGGIITREDFAQRPGHVTDPVAGEIAAGIGLTVTPRPTHGPQLIEIARRALSGAGDLASVVRGARADAKRAGREPADGGTSVVAAADDQGNAVILLHSNSFPQFASGMVLEDGLILNNRPGRGFDREAPAGAANAPAPGKVPWTTLHAWCLTRGDEVILGATPGGVNQLPWNAQTVTELGRGEDLADCMIAPRWSLDASNVLAAEAGVDPAIPADKLIDELSLRSAQQVISLSDRGLHTAAADPRTGATAVALY
jgi:gamma-glutamyltranspeptidase/glutathione hydrolase